jgi:hypothetical protein
VRVSLGEHLPRVREGVHGQARLVQIVGALRALGRAAGHLHRRQQQSNEHADDRYDHQQFDERETM